MKKLNVTYSERGFPQFDDAINTDYGHQVQTFMCLGSAAITLTCKPRS